MSGRNKTSPFSHRFVIALVVVILATSVVIDAAVVSRAIRSPVGIAAVVAMVVGLTVRRLMALTPWYLLAVALSVDVLLPVLEGNWALALSLAQYALLGGACLTGIVQVKVELSGRRELEEGSLVAWGSAMVALSVLVLALVNR